MNVLRQDLRYGARLLWRSPGFSGLVVLVLALGIGANSAIFSVVNAVLLRPLPYRDPGRLYRLAETTPKGEIYGVPPADLFIFQQRTRAFEAMALSRWQNITLTGPEGPENIYGGLVSSDTFSLLGRQPALGRTFRAEEFQPGAPEVVLLSDRLWQRRFGRNPGIVGRTLVMNDKASTIVGVMPADFFVGMRFELWTPWKFTAEDRGRRGQRANCTVRLRAGVTPQQAQAEVLAAYREIVPEEGKQGWGIGLTSVAEELTHEVRSSLLVSLGAVGFVLLIACLNAANLLLVRASERCGEIAIRAALGAGRTRMVRQLLTESLLLALTGGAAGLLLGAGSAKALVKMFPERLPVPRLEQAHTDMAVLLFTLGLSIATGIAFGLIPALQLSPANLADALKGGGRGSTGNASAQRLRSLLVIAETALSFILLIGAGLMLRSFDRLMAVNPGFNPEHVLSMRVPLPAAVKGKAGQRDYYTRILKRLEGLPGLHAAGLIVPLPLASVNAMGTFAVEGRPAEPGREQIVSLRVASPGYFRAMGLTLREGRFFGESDGAEAPGVAVVSEALARKYFPGVDPVGRRVTMDAEGKGPFLTVVGVVNDVKNMELKADPEPALYRDYRQYLLAPFATALTIRADGPDPLRLAAEAQKAVRAASPDQPISDVKTMREVIADNVSQPRFYTLLLGVYASLAVVLAAAGLGGVLSYSVSRRTREIGVRIALGASRGVVYRLVAVEALGLVSAGIVLGLAGSLALTRLIASQLYQTAPTDAATFAVVAPAMILVAAAATFFPARRAASIEPMIALRCE